MISGDAVTMRHGLLIFVMLFCNWASAALPGVTELGKTPEAVTDRELATLLDKRVIQADVVAIGESVHGSAAMLHMQTRLIRYLVVNHGIRLLVWETGVLRSLELSRWVAACAHTRTPPPIEVLYMPTAADLPLWEWICDYNRANPGAPVVFRGMDVWDRPWLHYAQLQSAAAAAAIDSKVLDAVSANCPGYRATEWAQMDGVIAQLQRPGSTLRESGHERCRVALSGVIDHARQRAKQLQGANPVGAGTAFEAALSASTLLGWLGFHFYDGVDDIRSWNERDIAQGRNLMLIMAQHGAERAILSAHISHVSHNRSPANWWGYGDLKSGAYFYQQLSGRRVFNIALTAYQASGTQGEWMLPTAANSIDKVLYEAGHRLAFFHADAGFLSAHPRWWMQNGNAIGLENGIELVPRDHFDAYFFFDQSLLDRPLPARPIWQP
jgi:erythromycin esterase-like protein